jgi:hypothetical protein
VSALRLFADEAMEQLELRRQLNECESERGDGEGTGDDGGDPE